MDVVTDIAPLSHGTQAALTALHLRQSRLLCGGTREGISVLAFPPSVLHTSPAAVFKAVFNEGKVYVVMVKLNFLVSCFCQRLFQMLMDFTVKKIPEFLQCFPS